MKKLIIAILLLASTAYAQEAIELEFAWDAYADANATGLRLQMADVSGGPYSTIADFPTTATDEFVDISMEAGTVRYFILRAYNATAESAPSNEVSFFLPPLPPDSGSITVPVQLRIKSWERVLSQ